MATFPSSEMRAVMREDYHATTAPSARNRR